MFGGAAHRAGVADDDILVEVNGLNVENCTHEEVVDMIRGTGETLILLVAERKAYDHLKATGVAITPALLGLEATRQPSPKLSVVSEDSDDDEKEEEEEEEEKKTEEARAEEKEEESEKEEEKAEEDARPDTPTSEPRARVSGFTHTHTHNLHFNIHILINLHTGIIMAVVGQYISASAY